MLLTIVFNIIFFVPSIVAIGEIPSFPSARRPSGCIGEEGIPQTSYDRLLCHELRVLQEEFDRVELLKLSSLFEQFVSQLRTFVNERNFDFRNFQTKTQDLFSQLSNLLTRAEEYTFDDQLRAQFLFTLEYFNVFRDSARFMGCYDSMKLPGNTLVYRVIELYVRTFSLQNSYGEVDESVLNYDQKVLNILLELNNYQKLLEQLENVSFFIEIMFHDQAGKTKLVVETLANKFLST